MSDARPTSIWTIGHSTRPIAVFLFLLRSCAIEVLADVRRFPASRKFPQFNRDALREALTAAGIEYMEFPELGGRRRARKDSRNTRWRDAGFRGYADYMETEAFQAGISRLLGIAGARRTAFLCAEAAWQRCHRSLISDYLKVLGVEVVHILDDGETEVHPYTSAARIVDGRLSYADGPSHADGREAE